MYQPMASGNAPAPPKRSVLDISELRGVDLFNAPANVDDSRSPDAPNMIRDVPGKVRKRMGYEQTDAYDGRINGVFYLLDEEGTHRIVHAGTKLYDGETVIYEDMNDTRSKAWQFDQKLYLLDGKTYLVYGLLEDKEAAADQPQKKYQVKKVSEIAYVPTVIISRNPEGGGTALLPLNLLSRKWTDSFYGKENVKEYQLTAKNLDDTPVTAKKMKSDGTWQDLKETADFSVDRKTGKVTFVTAPGVSPKTGEDNVKITASKIRGSYEKTSDSFSAEAGQTQFTLSALAVGDEEVVAKVLEASGSFSEIKEGGGITVDRSEKKVTFSAAPGVSPESGRDNVVIEYQGMTETYEDRINRCDVSVLYGINGAADRLFATGNPKYPNQDWYSQMNDPTFFGDLWYATLGQDSSRILGYSIVNGRLAAHKDEGEDGRNVILRSGTLENGSAAFPIVGTLQGAGALGKYSFSYLSNEPLFLTALGVYAITPADITGERYAESRSFYINRALNEEPGREEAVGCTFQDFYLLAVNNRVYVLDGLQKLYVKNQPYSTYQYECYYLENIPARVMWVHNGRLWFGTEDGKIMRFYNNPEAQESYNDCGAPILSHWDLPDIDGKLFYKNKTFRYFAVRLASAIATGLRVQVQKRGVWYDLFDSGAKARYFDFGYIDFEKLSFSSDRTPRTIGTKIKVKKADKARFRLENNELNEPFGIYNIALEYVESGNYKG